MASFMTRLLEGQNLNELNKLAQDGDPKHLGVVGFNLTLMNRIESSRARSEAAVVEHHSPLPDAELRAQLAREASEEEAARDLAEAVRVSRIKAMAREERIKAMPDSDEAVDDFIDLL